MQNRTEQDVLEIYKHTDRITRSQMWIRFPAFRKIFDEIDGNTDNQRKVSRVAPWSDWFKKKKNHV